MSEDWDDAPYVCPDCHAVGGERCASDCPDDAIARWFEARDYEVDVCGVCGGGEFDRCICPDDYDGWPERER